MQVETHNTVAVEEALEEIAGSPKAIRITNDEEETFIRVAPEDDRRDGFLVNVPIPILDDRHTIPVEDERQIRTIITNAETAQIIRVNDTPWSPLYNEA